MNFKKILHYGILGLLFITPFLANFVSDSMFFPFITGKNFTFRILVELIAALWIILLIIDKEYRPKFSWILASTGAFITALFVADISGVDSHRSIWSNFERMEGFVALIHFFVYFFVLGSTMLKEKYWQIFANIWLFASLFVAFGAFRQIYGMEQYYFGGGRVDAGLGNAAYMGIYVVLNAFLALLLWFKTDKDKWYRWFYPIFFLLNVYLTFKSQTRGSMLGLFGGIALAGLLFAIFDKSRPKFRKYAFIALGSFVVIVGLFIANRDAKWIQNYPSLNRIASISTTDSTTDTRLTVWKISYNGFKENPILGWGQDNFIYVFAKYYEPNMWKYEPWYDRSHNVFFDWLIAAGLIGLLTYLLMYVGILYYLWIYKKGSKFDFSERVIITGMIAAYFIHNLFVFDNMVSYMFFFALLGYIHSKVREEKEIDSEKKNKKDNVGLDNGDIVIVSSVILVVFSALIYFVNYRDVVSNKTLIKSLRGETAIYTENGKQKIRILDALKDATIGRSEIREQVVQQASQVLQRSEIPDDLKKQYVTEAIKVIDTTLKETPSDLRMLSSAVNFYSMIGNTEKADYYFDQSIKTSPARGMLYLDYINIKLMKGDYDSALLLAQKAVELMPTNNKAKTAYASILILKGKATDAKKLISEMKGSVDLLDDRLVYAYGVIRAYNEIITNYESVVDKTQLTSRHSLYYADALQSIGRKAEAITVLKSVAEKDQNMRPQIEKYISQIK